MSESSIIMPDGDNKQIYVPLHCHTEHSVLDGLSKPSELAKRARELGMPACAITDHGAMSGCVEFYQACLKEGIKPILGMEAYTTPYGHTLDERVPYDIKELRDVPGRGHQRNNYHLILLAKDYEGFTNLCTLHTASYAQGYYYKPRIDFELLKQHHEGLICSNACFTSGHQVRVKSTKGGIVTQNIEDVKAGQYVLTHDNTWQEVIEPTKRKYNGDGYRIVITNQLAHEREITCTANHEFFVYRRDTNSTDWVSADSLCKNDVLLEPLRGNKKKTNIITVNGVKYRMKRVANIEKIHLDEEVYCLNVSTNHDFVCNGVIVHNCVLGEVNHHLLKEDFGMAREHALRLQELFGDDYYFEIMNHGLDMEIAIMPRIRELAKELGIKVIATNDNHFTYKEDAKLQRTMMLLGMHKSWSDADVVGSFFEDDILSSNAQKLTEGADGDSDPIFAMPPSLYVKDYNEMMEVLCLTSEDEQYARQELANTLEIAEKCNCELPIIDPNDMSQYHTPLYAIEKDIQYDEYKDSGFELRQTTIDKVVEAMNAAGKEGSTLDEVLTEHEKASLHFLMWMCEKGIDERIRPKIEARGEPLPIEFYMENPPEGFQVVHKHNSPDESYIKGKLAEGLTPEDIINEYLNRLDYEVSVVCRKGFLDYFSIVQQYCNYARFNDSPPGPGRGCFLPGTMVLTTDGYKAIADITLKDMVFDDEGQICSLLDKFVYDISEDISIVSFVSPEIPDVSCTKDHKFEVWRDYNEVLSASETEWIEASKLKPGMYAVQHRKAAEGSFLDFEKHIFDLASLMKPEKDMAIALTSGNDVAIRIENVLSRPYSGKVYDLCVETENHHSFALQSCHVSNSGAGALLNYLLGITSVDPLPNKLIFERFLNPDRVGYPDIDVDFDKAFRDGLGEYSEEEGGDGLGGGLKGYLRREYGADNAAGVSTFIYAWGKAALRAAARVLFNPPESVQWADDLCNLIDDHPKLDLNSELQEGVNPNFVAKVNSARHYKQILDLALMLQGRITGTSIHASAFILSPHSITDKMPLTVPKAERERVQKTGEKTVDYLIAFDGDVTQTALGYVKLDLLCIKDLEVLTLTMKTIERVYGCKIDIENIPMDDEAVFQMLYDHNVAGIFQLDGSAGMAQVMDDVKPQSIEEMNAVIALFRPGPMDYIPNYVNGKWHPETVKYLDPRLEPILKDTYGVCCYQEEAMQITQAIAGFTGGQADNYRKQAAKKHMDQLVLIKDDFINGALANGTDSAVADELWEQLVKFGSYAFNRSHSAAYAYIAYRGGFLKAHFPEAFLAAMCSIKPMMKKVDKVPSYLEEARQMGVTVKPPHVNYSMDGFDVPEKGVIAFGLGGVKRVGQGAGPIIAEREANGPYKDFTDFCTRVPKQVGKAPIEALIKAGALDGLGWSRMAMEESIDQIVDFRKRWFAEQEKKSLFADDLFGMDDDLDEGDPGIELVAPFETEYSERELMNKEKEQFGMYFNKDPRDFCRVSRYITETRLAEQSRTAFKAGAYDHPRFVNVSEITSLPDKTLVQFIGNIRETRAFRTKKGDMMASVFIWDNGVAESSRFGFAPTKSEIKCTIFPKTWASTTPPLTDDVVVVTGRVSVDENGEWPTAVLVDKIETLAPDSDWISSSASIDRAKEYQEAYAAMIERDNELSDPSSKRYLIPAIEFKNTTDLDAFLLDPDLDKYRGEGRVQVSVRDDETGNRTEVISLRQTRGMVAFAARYGGVAAKIRLPKAQRALERQKMMGGLSSEED